jgi:hypothetical protein
MNSPVKEIGKKPILHECAASMRLSLARINIHPGSPLKYISRIRFDQHGGANAITRALRGRELNMIHFHVSCRSAAAGGAAARPITSICNAPASHMQAGN